MSKTKNLVLELSVREAACVVGALTVMRQNVAHSLAENPGNKDLAGMMDAATSTLEKFNTAIKSHKEEGGE